MRKADIDGYVACRPPAPFEIRRVDGRRSRFTNVERFIVGRTSLAKKTQRDKDWPMVRRLVEADVDGAPPDPGPERALFWLREGRTADLLEELAARFPALARRAARGRPALRSVLRGDAAGAAEVLRAEQDRERERDRRWWAPLRRELEGWRRGRARAP